jgi:hypothetical protein
VGLKMRRIIFASAIFVAQLAFSPASAVVVDVNLNTFGPSGAAYCPGYCAVSSGPIYAYSGHPGDQINFGTVSIVWDQIYYHGLPENYSIGWPWPGYDAYLLSSVGVSYDPTVQAWSGWSLTLCPTGTNCNLQPQSFDLTFTLQPSGFVSFGWFADYTYTPPEPLASAVPEPSTWAMLLIGFAGIGFVALRRCATLVH